MTEKSGPKISEDSEVQVDERVQLKRPRRYAVVMHNDDFTIQEFVVHVLLKFFHKETSDAMRLMLTVHIKGKDTVGLFPKDIALTKVDQVISYARQNEMPLLLTAHQT